MSEITAGELPVIEAPTMMSESEKKVLMWRDLRLREMGFSDIQAGLLAATRTCDLHFAQDLLIRCPHELAFEILR